jgi:hypothetical protein
VRRALLIGLVGVLLAACAGPPKGQSGPARGPAPNYERVAAAYNRRIAPLGSLWARTVIRIWYPDREGRERSDQVEGYFQFRLPRSINVTLQKVGETGAVLGSNESRYWWIELSKESRVARVGEHAKVTPERIAELGLPVYPLDLVSLLGITPVPEGAAGAGHTGWSADGRYLVVTVRSAESGSRRFLLDPQTYEPAAIEALDTAGRAVLVSELSKYEAVNQIGSGAGERPRIATEIVASFDGGRTRIRMRLNDPESGGRRPPAAAFDLETLLRSYGVRRVESLDDAADATGEAASEKSTRRGSEGRVGAPWSEGDGGPAARPAGSQGQS